MTKEQFSQALLQHRQRLNLSQEQAANIIGVSLRQYSNWELRHAVPKQVTMTGALAKLEEYKP